MVSPVIEFIKIKSPLQCSISLNCFLALRYLNLKVLFCRRKSLGLTQSVDTAILAYEHLVLRVGATTLGYVMDAEPAEMPFRLDL